MYSVIFSDTITPDPHSLVLLVAFYAVGLVHSFLRGLLMAVLPSTALITYAECIQTSKLLVDIVGG